MKLKWTFITILNSKFYFKRLKIIFKPKIEFINCQIAYCSNNSYDIIVDDEYGRPVNSERKKNTMEKNIIY